MWVLGGHCGILTGYFEKRVILEVMDVLYKPQGSYPESFMLMTFLEVCQEWGVLYVGTGGR